MSHAKGSVMLKTRRYVATTAKSGKSIVNFTVDTVSVMVNRPETMTGKRGDKVASIANQATLQCPLSAASRRILIDDTVR